jgi:hypothetical protein
LTRRQTPPNLCPWFLLAIAIALLAAALAPQPVAARQATPESIATFVTCDVAPRKADEIIALLPPPPEDGTVGQIIGVQPLPSGKPADPETVGAIVATVREMEVCINLLDHPRFHAFFGEAWFRQIPASEEIVAEFRAMDAATPTPIPAGQQIRFVGPWHIEVLPDGRVLAAVVWIIDQDAPCLDLSRTKALIFSQEDGRWVIDEIIEVIDEFQSISSEVGAPPAEFITTPSTFCEEWEAPSDRLLGDD